MFTGDQLLLKVTFQPLSRDNLTHNSENFAPQVETELQPPCGGGACAEGSRGLVWLHLKRQLLCSGTPPGTQQAGLWDRVTMTTTLKNTTSGTHIIFKRGVSGEIRGLASRDEQHLVNDTIT